MCVSMLAHRIECMLLTCLQKPHFMINVFTVQRHLFKDHRSDRTTSIGEVSVLGSTTQERFRLVCYTRYPCFNFI